MQLRQALHEVGGDALALLGIGDLVKIVPARHALHQDRSVGAREAQDPRHGHGRVLERAEHARLALERVLRVDSKTLSAVAAQEQRRGRATGVCDVDRPGLAHRRLARAVRDASARELLDPAPQRIGIGSDETHRL